jgi:hypothetical protein
MARMNVGRVVLGGLLAGLVINVGEYLASIVFKAQYDAMFAALNLPPMGGSTMVGLVIGGFAVGIILAWLYGAIRPRFGPGPMTALLAGLVVWALGWLWPAVVGEAMGLYNFSIGWWLASSAWGIVEVELAALVAGWLYRETDSAAPA